MAMSSSGEVEACVSAGVAPGRGGEGADGVRKGGEEATAALER